MAQYKPRTEFAAALSQISSERGVSMEVIVETIKSAILAAYRRDARERGLAISEDEEFEVKMNPDTGETSIFQKLENGKEENITPPGFSRIAAQTAKQVLSQKIREAEKSAVLEEYSKKIGSLVSGMILRFDGPFVVVDIGKTEAIMTPLEQVKNESLHLGQRLTFYLDDIREGPRGQQIVVSRSSEGLVKELFRREVPEVSNGSVEVKVIAREPGIRTKIAVVSNRPGIDPVGSCVGQKGIRVGEIISELFGEKIDIIQYDLDTARFITSALAPAEGLKVEIDEEKKTARVTVPEDQLSLAIGKEGQNVRLATKLTGYKIDIVGQRKAGGMVDQPAELALVETVETEKPVEAKEKKSKKKSVKKTSKPKRKAKSKSKEKEQE